MASCMNVLVGLGVLRAVRLEQVARGLEVLHLALAAFFASPWSCFWSFSSSA